MLASLAVTPTELSRPEIVPALLKLLVSKTTMAWLPLPTVTVPELEMVLRLFKMMATPLAPIVMVPLLVTLLLSPANDAIPAVLSAPTTAPLLVTMLLALIWIASKPLSTTVAPGTTLMVRPLTPAPATTPVLPGGAQVTVSLETGLLGRQLALAGRPSKTAISAADPASSKPERTMC